jgi:UDP-glucose 4-epimerase
MHETLVTREELMRSEENHSFYRIKNLEKINYDAFFVSGKYGELPEEGYTSYNTQRLTIDETIELLLSLDEIQSSLK